jgi:hypothetical protein
MKRTAEEKSKLLTKPAPRPRYRLSGRIVWSVLLVWAVLLVMIRAAFRFPANPAITFLIMFGLFFVALLVVRYTVLRVQVGWHKIRPVLVRWLARLLRRP